MPHSIFELFKVGVGPSSSHTVGPMAAAAGFATFLTEQKLLEQTFKVKVDLYGSLALTGLGHATDIACVMGLMGELPETIEADDIPTMVSMVKGSRDLPLAGQRFVPFDWSQDIVFHNDTFLPEHPNGMTCTAYDLKGNVVAEKTYFSIGGGAIVAKGLTEQATTSTSPLPYPFSSGNKLLALCKKHQLTIAEIMLANEQARSTEDPQIGLDHIWSVMDQCIERGIAQTGVLPGSLKLKRRANKISVDLSARKKRGEQVDSQEWVNLYAMAVNEENAAGGKVVTAPTNGAAGVIPAVLAYYIHFTAHKEQDCVQTGIHHFLATAAAIGSLYKANASISAAEVGCQGEIGVACSMAAAGLTEVLGGTPEQVENAAEIAMEHNLGLTCDPIDGLVQVPCIERNTMGAVKAINACRLALSGDGSHHVSLDDVVKTMHQTGLDMMNHYKETSLGGLAINVTAC
ncbi:L-serine ammonia-lyase [Photobacterium chitinilyticum]|uniref:L-serine dehydratase n=1 Tax=Photobacterium chitinilyticum TaxID=2485123 RepID=A0A3S3QU89_9GAMM|nr:L-serine ammonia-lyase [Photobacterium chitinilyticum]RWX56854.1 L-serine ammonia-lyase [Photobacterium chitinilyticum]